MPSSAQKFIYHTHKSWDLTDCFSIILLWVTVDSQLLYIKL